MLSQKLLQEWRGLLYTHCKCTLLIISYSVCGETTRAHHICLALLPGHIGDTELSSALVLERILWLPLPLKYEQKDVCSFQIKAFDSVLPRCFLFNSAANVQSLCWDMDPHGGSSLDPWVTWQQTLANSRQALCIRQRNFCSVIQVSGYFLHFC